MDTKNPYKIQLENSGKENEFFCKFSENSSYFIQFSNKKALYFVYDFLNS